MSPTHVIDWERAALIKVNCAVCGAGMAAILTPKSHAPVALVCLSRQHRIELHQLTPRNAPTTKSPSKSEPPEDDTEPNGEDEETAPDPKT